MDECGAGRFRLYNGGTMEIEKGVRVDGNSFLVSGVCSRGDNSAADGVSNAG